MAPELHQPGAAKPGLVETSVMLLKFAVQCAIGFAAFAAIVWLGLVLLLAAAAP